MSDKDSVDEQKAMEAMAEREITEKFEGICGK